MSAAVHTAVRAGITRIHFIAPTTTDFHVNVEGKSGIFATCGRDPRPLDGRFAVLADRTTTGSPAQWGEAVVRCHDDFDADDVVVEVNFGGDMATEVVKQAAERVHQRGERESNMIRIREVSAARGKEMRAEPISLLYEKGRVLHRRGLDQLEAEMMAFSREWDRAVDGSPNRLDAVIGESLD